jgi:hypothetical protein
MGVNSRHRKDIYDLHSGRNDMIKEAAKDLLKKYGARKGRMREVWTGGKEGLLPKGNMVNWSADSSARINLG